jgi:hypothetical protein
MARRLSTAGVRREYRRYRCNRFDFEEIEILGRAPVRVMGLWVDAWKALEATLVHAGYPQAENVGSYACRPIRDRVLPSLHSYRAAIDIDAPLNWRSWRLDYSRTRITADQVRAIEAIRTTDGWQAFRSGVHFRHIDPMHIQISAPIRSIKGGLDLSTVASYHHHEAHTVTHHSTDHRPKEIGVELRIVRRGDKGQLVRNLQGLLEAHSELLEIDGRFGKATEAAVRKFQNAHRLKADGIVGRRTWEKLVDA